MAPAEMPREVTSREWRINDGRPSRLAASRILSETAHDLRSPLCTVQESIRMVANGELGAVNDTQSQCLVDALSVCDSLQRLVSDMLQLERLQAGRTRARRDWFDLKPVCIQVGRALDSLLRPRKLRLDLDGIEATTPLVFGDPNKVGRLLENLVSNATRVVAEGSTIRIQAQIATDRRSLRVSVIDEGKGIDGQAWQRLVKRGLSEFGSEGLGFSICRQLAAAHHSPLMIYSREGWGTEVSFELPIGGLLSVASCWTQWRFNERSRVIPRRASELRDSDTNSALSSDTTTQPTNALSDLSDMGPQRSFVDDGVHLLLLHYDGPPPICRNSAAMLTVTAGATVPSHLVEAFDEKLQQDQRAFDFVYRASERRWVVIWDCDDNAIAERIESATIVNDGGHRRSLRLRWSSARRLSLDSWHAATNLADMIARLSLGELEPAGLLDDDMSSDGTTLVPRSDIPESRLQTELHHLAKRIGRQSRAIANGIR